MSRLRCPPSSNASIALALAACVLAAPAAAQLTALGNQLLDECDNAPDPCETDDRFGSALAAGDFDGDGYEDLAVGVPGEAVSAQPAAGAIHVFYGSAAGLLLTGDQVLTQASPGVAGTPESNDQWGEVLLAGRFDDDAFDDLAIGAPREDIVQGAANLSNAGAVWILFGSAAGLTGAGSFYFDQDHLPCCSNESAETGDFFGAALALRHPSGGLPHDSLFVGAPFENGLVSDEGVVTLITNSGGLLNASLDIRQSDFFGACGDLGESGDAFGFSLVGGRFGGGETVAIGAPFEEISLVPNAGKLGMLDSGYLPTACWDQGSPGVLDTRESFDELARALAAGDFDADGFDDLAIGVPGENNSGAGGDGEGIVQVLYGSSAGVQSLGDQRFTQASFSAENVAEPGDELGSSLAAGDFNGDGRDDLAIGVPNEAIVAAGLNRPAAGLVQVLYAAPGGAGLAVGGNQTFHQDFPAGMLGAVGSSDRFGAALVAGDFDGNGTKDLAIGVPGDNPGVSNAGRVQVLYGIDAAIGAFGTVQFLADASFSESDLPQLLAVTRTGSARLAATVDYRRAGGTALPGVDFTLVEGTIGWNAGDLTDKELVILLHEDTLDEPNETVVLELQDPSPGLSLGAPATMIITIVDDDIGGSLQFGTTSYQVGEADGLAEVTVTRTGGSASGVTVDYETFEAGAGSAVPGEDYVPVTGTLGFTADQTSQTFSVPILDDPTDEATETIVLKLFSPSGGGTLGTPVQATLSVIDDDPAGQIFLDSFESADASHWSGTVGGS